MIYLDNAATSGHKPIEVINAVNYSLKYLNANAGRSGHKLGLQLSQAIFDTRQKVKKLLNANNNSNVVFSYNTTTALNQAILGSVVKGGHIITSVCEHNSVLRPIMRLVQLGLIEATFVQPNIEGKITASIVEEAIKPNTYAIALTHTSNVTAYYTCLEEVGNIANKYKLLYIIDAAQAIGYVDIDVTKCNIDLLAFPAHKGLNGIQGCGVLYIKDKTPIQPITFGGTGTDSHLPTQPTTLPECLESGTLNSVAILALNACIDVYNRDHITQSRRQKYLTNYCFDSIEKIPTAQLYSLKDNNCGIVSFRIGSSDVGLMCDTLSDKYNIAVRGGLHCAPLMHKYLNTIDSGLIRASISCFNTPNEVEAFIYAVGKISKNI